jgi:hypothetical protein
MVADTTRCPAAVSVSTACHVCLAGARREGKDEDEQVCASCPATPARPRGISERGVGTGAHCQSRRAMADLRGSKGRARQRGDHGCLETGKVAVLLLHMCRLVAGPKQETRRTSQCKRALSTFLNILNRASKQGVLHNVNEPFLRF